MATKGTRMILDKADIAKLHAGETIEHRTTGMLVFGNSYAVRRSGSTGAVACRAKVTGMSHDGTHWVHALEIDRHRIEAPRLLHRRSQNGYTTTPSMAMSMEPEAVDVDTQHRITKTARDHHAVRNAQALAEMEVKSAARALRQAGIEAVRAGQDIEDFLAVVRRELDGLREGRAA
jgi:hypothetical protein